MITITKHAYDRARERMAINHHALDRFAETVYSRGLTYADTRGLLNQYINRLYMEHQASDNIRLYGEYVFIFSNQTLITVYKLPNELRRFLKAFRKKG